jgi:dTDP-4-dehydrorhamnose reductase
MPTRVVVIGARGQLGTDLVAALAARGAEQFTAVALNHDEIEVRDSAATRSALEALAPAVVINTAAFHRVDDCEDAADAAFAVNAIAVRNLALVCRDLDAAFVHFSTDYVFGGETGRANPYPESAPPAPINLYGASKLAGEHLLRQSCPRHFLVRTSGLFGLAGSSGKGGNFVELMLRLAAAGRPIRVVADQRLAPTYTADLAAAVVALVRTDRYGLYHVTNSGGCSWFEFASAVFSLAGVRADLTPTTSAEFGAKAARPAYSVLTGEAWRANGFPALRGWREALAAYLDERTRRAADRQT